MMLGRIPCSTLLRWEFILDLLSALRFPAKMIRWIRACICSPKLSISINGSLEGFFANSRGIRQGDPLSPYIFVLVMDALSMIIANKVSLNGRFCFRWRCDQAKITHLCFADDLFLFCGGQPDSAAILKQAMYSFFVLSSLSANASKSQIFVAGPDIHYRNELVSIFGFQLGSLPVRYLGVPLISTELSAKDCKYLLEKIGARIKSWTSKHLSYAGRLQLINFMLFSLQIYWMSLFILPKKVLEQLAYEILSLDWARSKTKRC